MKDLSKSTLLFVLWGIFFKDNKQPVISFVFQESSSKGVMHEIDNNQLFCGYNLNALFIFCRVIKVVDGQFSCNITFSIVLMNNSYSILHEWYHAKKTLTRYNEIKEPERFNDEWWNKVLKQELKWLIFACVILFYSTLMMKTIVNSLFNHDMYSLVKNVGTLNVSLKCKTFLFNWST